MREMYRFNFIAYVRALFEAKLNGSHLVALRTRGSCFIVQVFGVA